MTTTDLQCSRLNAVLEGRHIDGVTFVRDYLQLDCGDGVVNLYDWPIVKQSGDERSFGDAGYRTALVSCVGGAIEGVTIEPEVAGEIHLDDGRTLKWSLSPELGLTETVVFTVGEEVWIW
ncbi:MAG TPA: hypothetical protein VNA88_19340 [Candidatus Kapabacteria bacterium]|nr:hypothetical protein [Candidatus Kapabacteria bacterium]